MHLHVEWLIVAAGVLIIVGGAYALRHRERVAAFFRSSAPLAGKDPARYTTAKITVPLIGFIVIGVGWVLAGFFGATLSHH